ncbi:MAG: hypothetical protein LBI28_00110 [Treponema sp.]|jgi:hypothetical protein|nr:hypothetical protein [Treponema sp.]
MKKGYIFKIILPVIFLLIIFSACEQKGFVRTDDSVICVFNTSFIGQEGINPLPLLETTGKIEYDIIINYLFNTYENPVIENYYYSIELYPESINPKIYNIYYEITPDKNIIYCRGEPLGQCFYICFNENHEFLRAIH